MKKQRMNFKLLALLLFGMFLLLAVYGGYSVMTYGNRWFSSSRNPRVRAQKEAVIAGDILDRNGVVLATTTDQGRQYQPSAEARSAVVHLLGDTQGQVSNGVETFQTNYLYGFQTSLSEMFDSLFTTEQRKGDNVTLTIDSALCTEITRYFDSNDTNSARGAAVVLNYKTGETLASVSLPTFDPMYITSATLNHPGHPFWNRVTQAVYPPGSTFKIITVAAALDNLSNAHSLSFLCEGGLAVDAIHTIRDYASETHGALSLKNAFRVSCNNTFASIALSYLGDRTLRTTAENFGFNDNFLFRDLVVENSAYPTTNRTPYEVAMSGIGQSAIVASPMHMCMVAAAIANDGVMMEPRLLLSVDSQTGVNRTAYQANAYRTVLTPATAQTIGSYMDAVVDNGSGRRADVSGLNICGKTGTAESTSASKAINYGWFVGYIDNDELPFAVCVLVEDIDDGESGGTTAAPIAGSIFRYLKAHPGLANTAP